MPEMDGYAASIAIREGKAGAEYLKIPIVAMTANAMAGDREKCLISGMNDYVSKPINLSTLRTALIKWLNGNIIPNESNVSINKSKADGFDEKTTELRIWDEADALKRLGGKKKLLLKVLESFVHESVQMMKGLETAIAQNDLSNAELYAHSIKGSAGNVSALQLQALAKTIEFAAKNGDERVVRAGVVNLKKAIHEVCAVFEKEFAQEVKPVAEKQSLDVSKMRIKLQNLYKELESDAFIDTQALDIFSDYTDEVFTASMSVLKGHIDRFDRSEARTLLATIMARLE